MLYLAPPFRIIDGISLFRDHADPLQWYFGPLMPHFSTEFDEEVDADIPRLSLIKYRGDTGSGGFLNFDVDLGIPDEKRDELETRIMALEQLDDRPRLSPINYVDGSVRLMMLGADSAADGDGASSGNDQGASFVTKINHASKPALFGDNNAIFSAELGPEGVEILEKSLAGELAPIGVVYSLDFLALRPAYNVTLEIDWDRVQKHVNTSYGVDSIFASVDIENTVDELIEDRTIQLDVTSEFLDNEDNAELAGRRDRALNDVRAMVTDTFFEPSIVPDQKEEDGWDKAEKLARSAATLAATGGWGGIAKFKLKHVNQQRTDKKRLNVNYSERSTVLRSIYPQRHLDGMFRLTRDAGVPLDRFVTSVTTGGAFFRRRTLRLTANTKFEEEGVAMIIAHVRYGRDEKSVRLKEGENDETIEFNSIIKRGVMQREVEVRYDVIFNDDAADERPSSLSSEPVTVTVDELALSPSELYNQVPIELDASSVPFDDYPVVEAHIHFKDEANGLRQRDSFRFDKDKQKQTFNLFFIDPEKRSFDVRVIYRAADNKDIELPIMRRVDELVTIENPFPDKRTLQVVPAVNWNDVSMVFVDLTYVDPDNDINDTESLMFDKDNRKPAVFEANLKDPHKKAVSYKVTILFNDGGMTEVPTSVTFDSRIMIRSDMKGHKVVTVVPPQIDFEDEKIDKLEVEIEYQDPLMGLSFVDKFVFDDPDDRGLFEYDYVDAQRDNYRFRVTERLTTGAKRGGRDWTESDDDLLTIEID